MVQAGDPPFEFKWARDGQPLEHQGRNFIFLPFSPFFPPFFQGTFPLFPGYSLQLIYYASFSSYNLLKRKAKKKSTIFFILMRYSHLGPMAQENLAPRYSLDPSFSGDTSSPSCIKVATHIQYLNLPCIYCFVEFPQLTIIIFRGGYQENDTSLSVYLLGSMRVYYP